MMAELTKEQMKQAIYAQSDAIKKYQEALPFPQFIDTIAKHEELCETGLRAAAPYLQLQWDEPTDAEVHQANTKGSSYCVVPNEAARVLIVRFINHRNAAFQPKPVDPRRKVIEDVLRSHRAQIDNGRTTVEYLVAEILES
jgi:hypothetical protein